MQVKNKKTKKGNNKQFLKKGFVFVLLLASAINGFAKDVTGTVKRKMYVPNGDQIDSRMIILPEGEKAPDTTILLFSIDFLLQTLLLDEAIQEGSVLIYDDKETSTV